MRPDAALALAASAGGNCLPLRLGRRVLARLREHRWLRRDVGDEAAPLHSSPDALGGEAGVGGDRGEFGTGEAGAVEDRVECVALVTGCLFTEQGDDAARLRVDRHLAAEDEVRTLARFAAQLRIGIGTRDRRLVRAPALRRRT